MRDEIIDFGKKHNYELSEITFQCDDDCQSFLKQNGLRCNTIEQKNLIRVKNHNNSDTGYDNETYAYVLSDLVAWSNNRGKEPHGVIFKNLGDALEKEMMQAVR